MGETQQAFLVQSRVIANWVIRSGNKPFEKGIPFLYYLQTREGEGKIGSRQYI